MRDRPTPDLGPRRGHGRDITERGWLVLCSGGCHDTVSRDPPAVGDPCPICGPPKHRREKVTFVGPFVSDLGEVKPIGEAKAVPNKSPEPWDVDLGEFMNDVEDDGDSSVTLGCGGNVDLDVGEMSDVRDQPDDLVNHPPDASDSSFFGSSSGHTEALVFELGDEAVPLSEMPSSLNLASLGRENWPMTAVLTGPLSALTAFGLTIFLLDNAIPVAAIGVVCGTVGLATPVLIRGVLLR